MSLFPTHHGPSIALKGTTARLRSLGTAKEFEALSSADREVFGLDGGDGIDVGEIHDPDQAGVLFPHFPAALRADELHARPGRKSEKALNADRDCVGVAAAERAVIGL